MAVDNLSNSPEGSAANLSGEWTDPQWVGARPAAFGQLAPGDVIGRCKIIRELGTGGMGAVYLATHTTLQVDVALKILPPVMAKERAEVAQRFIREAQLAARIRHPNVVSVMDADVDPATGLYYIVFEFVSGGSLAQRLRQGPIPETETIRIILDIAQALVVAAENGIVHRDIKPDNIMLDSRGNAKLADLGLAKQEISAVTSQLTQGGASVGTPSYMSPDQIRDAQSADAQDDLYSLGATFYECLTGTPPFAAINPYNAVGQILFTPTPDPRALRSNVSSELAAICMKLMAKKKSDRYPNAQALIDELQAFKTASMIGQFLPQWAREAPVQGLKAVDRIQQQINPGNRVRIVDIFLFGIVLALTIWVVRTMLTEDQPVAVHPSKSSPSALTSSEPQAAPDVTALAQRALPVENDSQPLNTSPLTFQSATSSIALPPPEPMPGEDQPASPEAVAVEPGISAFEAKALAEQMVPENVRLNLMQISGPRRAGNLSPSYWRFLFWDPNADQHVRAVTVTGSTASPAKEGFVELGKLRVVSYKRTEVIDPARFKIDSTKALEIARTTPELQGVTLNSAAFFLDKAKGNLPPVWRLTLYALRNNDEVQLGDVRISAETGIILEFGIKLNRLPTLP